MLAGVRGDTAAAGYASDAIDLCRRSGSQAQLMVALPTAAMVCWQVGALEEARAYVAEALPMHGVSHGIARVVLLSTAAGVALADGDIGAAVEFGATADREASELGVEREVPLASPAPGYRLSGPGAVSGIRAARGSRRSA